MDVAAPQKTVPYEVFQRERERRIQAEKEAAHWKHEFYLLRQIRRAPVLKPVDKEVLSEFRHVQQWGTVEDGDGHKRANYTTIAGNLHISPDTVARSAERLERLQLAEIREHQGPQDERERKYIHVDDANLASISQLEDPEGVVKKQGGNRYICPECDSPYVEIKKVTSLRCLACGHEETIDNTGWIMQNGHKAQKQLAFEKSIHAQQAEDAKATCFSEEREQESQKQLAVHGNPDTPPNTLQKQVASLEAFPDIPLTSEEQVAAAHLFLSIAGPGPKPEHVEMSRKGPCKYYTVHRALRIDDAYRHFRGIKTKGATLQHPNSETRAICDDGDNAQDFERLKECALQLANAGFQPILEPSPVPDGEHAGGGHLWIIFDSMVNVYAARRTLTYYAPRLAESKEYWPNAETEGINSRIRLPGGKYIKPGFEAWCPLYDAFGNLLSHEGNGAARVLLAFQSDSSRLIVCQKPEPPKQEPPPVLHTPPTRKAWAYLGDSLAKQIIDDFNASTSWQQLLGEPDSGGKYRAVWRNDTTPNVSINPATDKAKDFSKKAWPGADKAMDKYQVYCLIQGGQNWQEFRRLDLARRCKEVEQQGRRAS